MTRLNLLVKTEGLVMVENMQSPDDNAVYKGYVTPQGREKKGWGEQIWPDGGRYEGEWHNNRANGKGQFWHADGHQLPW